MEAAREFGVDVTLADRTTEAEPGGARASHACPGADCGIGERHGAQTQRMNLEIAVHRLCDAGVDFIVIGGWAAIFHGSARLTNDLILPKLESLLEAAQDE